jgi:hypothetical protein
LEIIRVFYGFYSHRKQGYFCLGCINILLTVKFIIFTPVFDEGLLMFLNMARCHDLTFSPDNTWHGAARSLYFRTAFGMVPRPFGILRRPLANCHGLTFFPDDLRHGAEAPLFCPDAFGTVPRPFGTLRQPLARCHVFTFFPDDPRHGAMASRCCYSAGDSKSPAE